ncbi:MAG TPA: hypothetical protein PLX80_08070 [Ignavibacteria bacterium]|nr:hypothetical protein [Ignavibacteria bacterium]
MKTLITLLIFLVSVSNVFFNSKEAKATNVIPLAYKSAIGDLSFIGPLANTSRTYQLIIHSNLLTDYLGKKITSLAWRLPASAGSNWPASNVTFSNYKILLSGSVTPANRSLAFFSDNVIGMQTQVRSGSLFIPAGSYPSGSSPNSYGPEIIFDVPYLYTGGNLLIEIRQSGFTGTTQSVDALSSFTGGYNLTYSACWKSSDTATYNAASGNFSIVKLFTAEVVPNDKEFTVGDSQFLGALSFDPKTYQLLIHSNQLTEFIGKKLTAISMRAYIGTSSSWPASDVTFSDYRIYLSGSVDPVNRSLAYFANNITGQQRLVRSGPLVIPAGSYSYGNSPNATGPEIIFNSPYIYNGGNLLIEIRHKGFTGTTLSVDANNFPATGYGTDFSACYKSTDTATFGALAGSFSTVRISSSEPLELNLKAYIQARYSSTANMMVPDTSKVLLRHSFSPYAPADTAAALSGSNGIGSFNFGQALQATAYYFVVRHRNSIETWSANTITFVGNDVSTSIAGNPSQAYGNNLIQVDNGPNAYAIYSSDINQDGTVDLSDGSLIDNDAINFVSGYVLTDNNGDLIVDVADAVFADNNGFNFVIKITP